MTTNLAGCLTFNNESAYFFFLQKKKKRKGNRSNPAWGRMQELCLASPTSRVLSCGCLSGLGVQVHGSKLLGGREQRSSPAFNSEDVLRRRGRRGAHARVRGGGRHGGAGVRHFSIFLFQSFSPPVYGCNFGLQRHVILSDFL